MANKDLITVTAKNETAIASATASAIAEIQSCLQLAKAFPRDTDQARRKILDMCKRPGFAKHVQYSKPIGNTPIRGISIRGAEVAANCWGNIKSMAGIVYDDDKKRIISVVCMDLETNSSYSSQVIVDRVVERSYIKEGQVKLYERKNTKGKKVYGVIPTDDEFEVKVASQVSKQMRNNILRIIPEDIKEEMIQTAEAVIRDKAAADPQGEIKNIVDAFAELRIMPNDIKSYLGHDIGKCSPHQVAELRIMHKTIKDGEAAWVDYLPIVTEEDGDTKPSTRTEQLKADLAKKTGPPETPPEQPKSEKGITPETSNAAPEGPKEVGEGIAPKAQKGSTPEKLENQGDNVENGAENASNRPTPTEKVNQQTGEIANNTCEEHGEENCGSCGVPEASLKEKVRKTYEALEPGNKRAYIAILYPDGNRQRLVINLLPEEKLKELDSAFRETGVY